MEEGDTEETSGDEPDDGVEFLLQQVAERLEQQETDEQAVEPEVRVEPSSWVRFKNRFTSFPATDFGWAWVLSLSIVFWFLLGFMLGTSLTPTTVTICEKGWFQDSRDYFWAWKASIFEFKQSFAWMDVLGLSVVQSSALWASGVATGPVGGLILGGLGSAYFQTISTPQHQANWSIGQEVMFRGAQFLSQKSNLHSQEGKAGAERQAVQGQQLWSYGKGKPAWQTDRWTHQGKNGGAGKANQPITVPDVAQNLR